MTEHAHTHTHTICHHPKSRDSWIKHCGHLPHIPESPVHSFSGSADERSTGRPLKAWEATRNQREGSWCTWRSSPGTPPPPPTLRPDMSCCCVPPLELKANWAGLRQLSWAEHRGTAAGWAWEPWCWTVYPCFHSPVHSREKRVWSHWMAALAFCLWFPADRKA